VAHAYPAILTERCSYQLTKTEVYCLSIEAHRLVNSCRTDMGRWRESGEEGLYQDFPSPSSTFGWINVRSTPTASQSRSLPKTAVSNSSGLSPACITEMHRVPGMNPVRSSTKMVLYSAIEHETAVEWHVACTEAYLPILQIEAAKVLSDFVIHADGGGEKFTQNIFASRQASLLILPRTPRARSQAGQGCRRILA
jgi:hypothetical protein